MATNAKNPIAAALDERIRAVVNESVSDAVREELRQILAEELAGLLGGETPAAKAPAPKARARATTRKATTMAKATPARRGRPRANAATAAGDDKLCNVVGCERPYRSRGYCAAHYQAARKYDWPMPAPANFEPPPRPSRGRPAASKAD